MEWPHGKRAAVSLTYDDGLPCHHQLVAPLLEACGLRGCFMLPGNAGDLASDPEAWRALAAAGHELGNHTLFHPCRADTPERSWVAPEYDLSRYTAKRFLDELRCANSMLHLVDGRGERCFGASCGDLSVGRGDDEQLLADEMAPLFTVMRGGLGGGHWVGSQRPQRVPSQGGDRRTADQLMLMVDECVRDQGWLTITWHGVGEGTHPHFIEVAEHERFVRTLAERNDVYVAPPSTVIACAFS